MTAAVFGMQAMAVVTVSRGKNSKFGYDMVEMKNSLLKVVINCDRGGILHSFVPVNSRHEEAYISADNKGGMCEHILAGSKYNREISFSPYKTVIEKNTPEKAVVSCSYRMKHGELEGLEFRKIYTMEADSAVLQVDWQIINHSAKHHGLSPWVRNIVTGYDQEAITAGKAPLDSDSSLMLTCGAFRKVASPADTFLEPARNWFSRVPKVPGKGKNILNVIFDYNEVFQFYTVHFKHMHTLELLFRFVDLAPGKSWSGKFMMTSGGSLPDVRFAGRQVAGDLVRADGKLKLSLTGSRQIRNAEVRVLTQAGKVVGSRRVHIPALEVVELNFSDAAGDIFELQVIENGKDLMIDRRYTGKTAVMTSSLSSFHALRRPEKFPRVLDAWKKDIPAFENPLPRKLDVPLLVSRNKNLQIWANDSLERIMEGDYPASAKAVPGVSYSLSAAKAERESFQLALRNSGKKMLKNISISLENSSLSGLQMQWNILEYIATERPSLGEKVIGRWPEVLQPDRDFAVSPGQTRVAWIEFRVPRKVAAGVYEISLKVKENGKVIAELPVRLRVFDFELPLTPHLRTDAGRFFGDQHKMARRYGFKGTGKQLLEALNLSLLDHRMSPRGLVESRNDLKAYEKDLIRHIKAGANVFAFPTSRNSSLKQRLEIEKIHARHNVLHLSYTYAFDEIHSEQIPAVRKWCADWKKTHKIPVLVVYYGGPVKPLYGAIDIWCRAFQKEDAELLADRLNKDEIWLTNTTLYAVEEPWVKERTDIWKTFSLGMKGRLLWSVASWTSSPYVSVFRSGKNLHGVLYYPAPEGVRPGVRLKVIADAVDDFDYLSILKSESEKAAKSGKQTEAVRQAAALLKDKFFLNPDISAGDYLKKRNLAGELIEKLRKINSEK